MIVMCILPSKAFDFEVNGIYYNVIDSEHKYVEVTEGPEEYANYSGDIIILENIETIGEKAFYGCINLGSITSLNNTPPICDISAFYGVDLSTCKLYVNENALSSYTIADVWKDFVNIEGGNFNGIENVKNDKNVTIIGRYDIQGRLLTSPIQGINILKMNDGSVRKEYVR